MSKSIAKRWPCFCKNVLRVAATISFAFVPMAALAGSPAGPAAVLSVVLSIDEAYRAIPHRRTEMNFAAAVSAGMPSAESEFLQKLFKLSDQGVALRVSNMKGQSAAADYDELIKQLDQLKPPAKLEKAYTLIKGAIQEHQRVFAATAKDKAAWSRQPEVQTSSGKLREAYSELMRLYPAQTATNKQAFFDYLCALDFL